MNEESTSISCLCAVHQIKNNVYENVRRYLCDKREPCLVALWISKLLSTWMWFRAQISPPLLPPGERQAEGLAWVSRYSSPAQETVAPLLLKSKALSVGCFMRALFQVCLGPLPVKCKQFTDLLRLGRAEGFSWEECNLNTASQGGSAARWSVHAYCVRA